jgi:carbon starvation protein
MSALVMSVYGIFVKLMAGKFVVLVDGLQLVVAICLMILALMVVTHCGKELFTGKASDKDSAAV